VDPPTDAEAFASVLDRVLAGENVLDNEKAVALLDRCSMDAFRQRVVEFFKTL
jgi:hypothetical protein